MILHGDWGLGPIPIKILKLKSFKVYFLKI